MIAWDTETTGLMIRHGCRPFMMTTCTPHVLAGKDSQTYWEWQVDPFTRVPVIPKSDVREITSFLNDSGEELGGWHIKFDLHALESIGVKLPPLKWCHDGMYMLHALDSLGVKGLKPVAYRDCDIPDDDESTMTRIIVRARRIAKKLGWAIAAPGHPHFGGFNPSSTSLEAETWVKMDMWIPREVVLRHPELIPKNEDPEVWESCCRIYALRDAYRTSRMIQVLIERLHQEDLWKQYTLNRRCLSVVYDIERRGITVHKPTVEANIEEYLSEHVRYADMARQIAGNPKLNLRSPKQMRKLLYTTWALPVERVTKIKNEPSLDATALMNMYDNVSNPKHIKQFVAYTLIARKYKKAGEDYLVTYRDSGIPSKFDADYLDLMPSLHLTPAATTRLASSNPNGQNIGTGRNPLADKIEEAEGISLNLRRVFRPIPGRTWFCVDYNQLQMRIIAAYTQDVRMLDGFAKGHKFHDVTCRALFDLKDDEPFDSGQKRIAKNCYHPNTEVLTPIGWKRIGDIKQTDLVAQADPSQGRDNVQLSWVHPTAVIKQQNASGQLIHFRNEGIDIRVTPDHRMLGWFQEGHLQKYNLPDIPVVETASDFKPSRSWSNAGYITTGGHNINPNAIRLAVAIQADGSYSANRIRFGFVKRRKIQRLEHLLQSLGVPYRKTVTGTDYRVTNFSILKSDVPQFLLLLDSQDKTFTWQILNLTFSQRMDFIEELGRWDGTNRYGKQTQIRYMSVVQKNHDIVQAVASITGMKTRFSTGLTCNYTSIKRKSDTKGGGTKRTVIPYNGEVVCLSVPSSFLLVRDAGIPIICGNCNFGFWFGAGEYKIDVVTTRVPGTWRKMRDSFPQAAGVMDDCIHRVARDGYINTMGGYRLGVPLKEKYKGFNYAIQGTEGEIVKKALVDCYGHLNRKFGHLSESERPYVLFTIHDEIIFDFPTAMPNKLSVLWQLCRLMEKAGDAYGVTTPVEAKEVLESWAETKDIHFPQRKAA